MTYRVVWHPAADRDLERVPSRDRQRITTRVERLADDPQPSGSTRVRGLDSVWRIRVGRYRVLYQVRKAAVVVIVGQVATRGAAYLQLETLRERLRSHEASS